MLSEYLGMWLVVMFDLPVDSVKARRDYARFRKNLLDEGFSMLQFSVYARYTASEQVATRLQQDVKAYLPPAGQVRFMGITDRQFGKMEVFYGKKRVATEQAPQQLELF